MRTIEQKWQPMMLKRVLYEVNLRNGHDRMMEFVESIYEDESVGTKTIVWRDKETNELIEMEYVYGEELPVSIKVTREV